VKPKLLVIAGPNGSGKTSVTNKILKHEWVEGCVYINPDNVANEMFGDWNSESSVLSAANYCKNLREECLTNLKSVCFETVLSAPDKLDYILRAKKSGFFIRLFFVGTASPVINAARVASRFINGGHDVPINKIVSRYSKSIANCCIAAKMVDRAYVYDNSVDFSDPALLFRTSNGRLEKKYTEISEWAKIIYGSICPEESIES